MLLSHFLGIELYRCTPHHSVPEVFNHVPVDFITEVLNCCPLPLNDDWRIVVRIFSFGFCIYSNEIEILPHSFDKLIQVPTQIASNRHIMLNLIQNVQLVKGNSIDFVEGIQTRYILPVALDHVDDVVFGCVALYQHICVVDTVFLQNGFDGLIAHSVRINHPRDSDTTFVLSFEIDLGRHLVEPNTEAFELMLYDFLMLHGSSGVEDDNDQVAGSSDGDNLFTSTLAVLGAFDDTGQVEQLYFGSFIL